MRFPLVLSFVTICSLGPSDASAQRYWAPDQLAYCDDDAAADECLVQTLELLLSKLQLPQAETLANDGFTGIRVFQYDAFRTIWPATFMLTKTNNEHWRDGTAEACACACGWPASYFKTADLGLCADRDGRRNQGDPRRSVQSAGTTNGSHCRSASSTDLFRCADYDNRGNQRGNRAQNVV